MPYKTRWAWYFLVGMIATTCAEALSGSTPIIFPTGIFVLVIYTLHYLLIFDFLAARNAITLRTLAVGGLVLGFTTESLITKVIWNPPWDEGEVIRILGLGAYEVGFIVVVWHAWMSMAIPFALALTCFGYADLLSPKQLRLILRLLPLSMLFIVSIGTPPITVIPIVLLNGVGIGLAAKWFQRQNQRHPLLSPTHMRLTRWERRLIWALTLLLYALLIPERREAFPTIGPFILGMFLMIGSIGLLVAVRRADTNGTPLPGEFRYRYRVFIRYQIYFLLVALPLAILAAVTAPISAAIAILVALVALLIGNGYMLRLVYQMVLSTRWRRQKGKQGDEVNISLADG
jgi:hypothetical protein